jgi:hypothetical protein
MKKSLRGCFCIYELAENKQWFVGLDVEWDPN